MIISIYQIPMESTTLMPFRDFEENKNNLDIKEYLKVYTYEDTKPEDVSMNSFLEDIYYIFNMEHPADFYGHSLSVSDVVQIDDKYYYCDTTGWQDITQYVNKN